MGGEVARLLAGQQEIDLVAGVEAPGHPMVGAGLGSGKVGTSLAPVFAGAHVVIDFSVPEAVAANAQMAAAAGKAYVTGVTGLSDEQTAALRAAAELVPVVHAPNFSMGVSVLSRLVADAARLLGPEYDIEIVEVHHRRKRDAPSGTARQLVDIIKSARAGSTVVSGREGQVGHKPAGEIGVSSVRTGEVVGEHTVIFGGPGESVELKHKAESRAAFAAGVLAAIRFVRGREPGLYSMSDVLAGRASSTV
jgi:4-hydroxy-tetrahydrodipicolinate reductase